MKMKVNKNWDGPLTEIVLFPHRCFNIDPTQSSWPSSLQREAY